MDFRETIFYYIGCLTTVLLLPRIVNYVLTYVLKRHRKVNVEANSDAYAIITGASDGIGLEYARELARRGFNLLLLSRTEEKLKKVKDDLEKKYNNQVDIFAVDFCRTDIYDEIEKKINSIPNKIAVLVNNVGMTRKDRLLFGFTEFHDDMHTKTLICNTYPVMRLCEIVLPIMEQQNAGIVINVSSIAGRAEVPYQTVYSATKAFVSTLTNCLSQEYSGSSIIFQNVEPNFVKTSFVHDVDTVGKLLIVDAKSVVVSSLECVGVQVHTTPHWRHAIGNGIILLFKTIFPNTLFMYCSRVLTRTIRSRTFKKSA